METKSLKSLMIVKTMGKTSDSFVINPETPKQKE